jgi:hypothetical protein
MTDPSVTHERAGCTDAGIVLAAGRSAGQTRREPGLASEMTEGSVTDHADHNEFSAPGG